MYLYSRINKISIFQIYICIYIFLAVNLPKHTSDLESVKTSQNIFERRKQIGDFAHKSAYM